jgi:hypothetical protein
MKYTLPTWLSTVAVCLLSMPTAFAQEAAPQDAESTDQAIHEAAQTNRLESLDPDFPQAYFTLGEEVAGDARTEEDFALAKRLYVMAIVLASEHDDGATLAASAAVALADITRAESDRRALWSVARMLDPRYGLRDWSRSTEVTITDDVAYLTATVLGKIRAGWGVTVMKDLRKPEVRRLIQRYSALITGSINQNIFPELERWAQAWPCPECRNERIVTKRHTGKIERRLCYTCGGNPGPKLTTEQLIGQLRFESFLLNSRQRSWGAQVAADLGEPLRDADISTLPLRFGVDPSLVLYRNGQWVSVEPSVEPPEATAEPPEPDAP